MISGFDFDTPLPIADAVRANYARNPIPEVPVSQFQVRGGVLYPDTGGPKAAWERHLLELHAARRLLVAAASRRPRCAAATGCSTTCSARTASAPTRPATRATTALTPSLDNGQTFVATLANPFPNGLLEPVGSGLGLMTNVGLGVSFPYVGEVRHAADPPLVDRRPARAAVAASWSRAPTSARTRRTSRCRRELNPVPGQYFSTSPVRDDATNNFLTAAGARIRSPGCCRAPTSTAPTSRARSCCAPYPQFTGITALETIGTSDYTSFQGRIERRMANGFTVQVAYTWSKTMAETGYLNAFDTELERVIGPFDRTHVFVTSGIVELPFGRDAALGTRLERRHRRLARRLAGLVPVQGAERRAARLRQLPVRAGRDDRRRRAVRRTGDEDRWFNVDAFNRVTAQQLVSNVRTQPSRFDEVRGPGYALLDLAFLKNVNLGSRMRAQFRAEVYNALNRANLGGPNTTPTSSALRHDHRAERPAAAAAARGAVEFLGVRTARSSQPEGRGQNKGFKFGQQAY